MQNELKRSLDLVIAALLVLACLTLYMARAAMTSRLPAVAALLPVPLMPAIVWSTAFALLYLSLRRWAPPEALVATLAMGMLSVIGLVEIYRLAPDLADRWSRNRDAYLSLPMVHTLHLVLGILALGLAAWYFAKHREAALGYLARVTTPMMAASIPIVIRAGLLGGTSSTVPVEVFKLAFTLMTAKILGGQMEEYAHPSGARQWVTTRVLPLLLLGATLAAPLLRRDATGPTPDTGPAVIAGGVLVIMLFLCGYRRPALLLLVGAAAVGFFCYGVLHAPSRLVARFDPVVHPFYTGDETVARILWALSSAGIVGTQLGMGGAARDIKNVEADYSFAAISEELGFAGGALVILLFMVLVAACFRIALRSQAVRERTLAMGVASLLAVQGAVIIGGNVALLPLTGITLPWVSNGGASLIINSLLLGMVIGLSTPSALQPVLPPYLQRLNTATCRNIRTVYACLLAALAIPLLRLTDIQLVRAASYRTQTFFNARKVEQAERCVQEGIVRDDGRGGVQVDAARAAGSPNAQRLARASERMVKDDAFENQDGQIRVTRETFSIHNPAVRRAEARIIKGRILDANGEECRINQAWFGTDDPRYGSSGLIAAVHPYLVGQEGRNLLERSVSAWKGQRMGSDVRLTIRPQVQKLAERALSGRRGVAVVVEPTTGRILAMAGAPSFPFATATREEWREARHGKGDAFFDKPVRGLYPPGSIFKLATAATALESGWDPKQTFLCTGHFRVPGTTYVVPDAQAGGRRGFQGHGRIDMAKALEVSCNCWFSQLALQLGPEKLSAFFEKAGFGRDYDLLGLSDDPKRQLRVRSGSLTTDPGNLANPASLAQTGFGQAQVETNPVSLAAFIAAIANQGVLQEPYLATGVVSRGGISKTEVGSHGQRRVLSPRVAALLTEMMLRVTTRGTGKKAQIPGIAVAGKTGSAQHGPRGVNGKRRPPHALFAAFAPTRGAHAAVLVIVEEGGMGGRAAAPIARQLLAASLTGKE